MGSPVSVGGGDRIYFLFTMLSILTGRMFEVMGAALLFLPCCMFTWLRGAKVCRCLFVGDTRGGGEENRRLGMAAVL